jgi:hypothetical protein
MDDFQPITKKIDELEALWRLTEDSLTIETAIEASALERDSRDSYDGTGTHISGH